MSKVGGDGEDRYSSLKWRDILSGMLEYIPSAVATLSDIKEVSKKRRAIDSSGNTWFVEEHHHHNTH